MPANSSRFSIKKAAWGAAAIILLVTIVSCIFKDQFENDYVVYILQVLSGNWPGKVVGLNEYFFIVCAIFAVLLNTAAVVGIVTGAYELSIIRRYRRMNIRNAFNVRDQIALQDIVTQIEALTERKLTDDERSSFKEKLWGCFLVADKKWENDFIPRAMPKDHKAFIEMISQNEPK